MALLKTVFKGESLSILVTFPESYDMTRIEELEIVVGAHICEHTISSQTAIVRLKSEQTQRFMGIQDLAISVQDSVIGVYKILAGQIQFDSIRSRYNSEADSDVYGIIVMLSVSESTITVEDVLFNYLKGKTAYEYAVEGGFTGTEEEFYIALGTISDPKDYIDFNDNPVNFIARRFGWDAANGTFAFGLPDGGSIQIGQEDFDFYTNVDTVPLTEGMPVSSVSIPGNRNAIKRTDPTSRASAEAFLGLVTVSSIPVNGVGRVTLRGEVSPFNTSGFVENATLYVTGTGTIGTTEPAAGTYKIIVGTVAVSSNNGTINVNKYIRPKLTELSDVDGTTTLMNNGDKLMKQESDGVVRFITYQNVKADLKNVNDALYEPILGFTPVDSADLGQANGVATLDNDGLVPASQLPSFVDDIVDAYGTYTDVSDPTTVIELWTDATHTVAVDKYTGKIYVDVVTRFQFRWSGSVWGAILSGPVQSVAGKTGNVLLAKGDVGLSNVDNTSDVNKPISTAVSIALGGKVSTTGDETIAGVKTFQSSPIVPDGATGKQAINYDGAVAYGAAVVAEVEEIVGLPAIEVETDINASELLVYRNEALAAKDAAEISETNALASELKAEQWAEEDEDVEIETGKYSAKHWAAKAEESTTGFTNTEIAFASIFNQQNARISALEEFIQTSLYNSVTVDSLSVISTLQFKGADFIRTGTGAPSFAPDFIGQIYIKTDATTAVYIATGITNSSDFKLL